MDGCPSVTVYKDKLYLTKFNAWAFVYYNKRLPIFLACLDEDSAGVTIHS